VKLLASFLGFSIHVRSPTCLPFAITPLMKCVLVQIVLPLTFAVVLVGLIKNREHDAATWSAISQQLQVTHWPLLLRSDSGTGNWLSKRIEWRVFFLSVLGLIGTASIIVAGFLTPRPLVESIRPLDKAQLAQFQYIAGKTNRRIF
jgi:hypothetical protein